MGELEHRYGVSRARVAQIFALAAGAVFCAIASSAFAKCHPAASGDVLLAGGYNGHQVTAAAEFFDPLTERFSRTCNKMSAPRVRAQAIVVVNPPPGENQILVFGGGGVPLLTTDVWNPITDKFQSGPTMEADTQLGSVVELADGRSLVTVGDGYGDTSDRAMIYDPATNQFTLLEQHMISRRSAAAAALISGCACPNEGKVLIAGGLSNFPKETFIATAELFDPATNSFAPTGNLQTAVLNGTATALSDGTILIAGGSDGSYSLNSAEIYDPSTETFAFTATNMNMYRQLHTATRLEDGTVLIAGGIYSHAGAPSNSLSSAEIYNPLSGTFVLTAQPMHSPRYLHSATLLGGTGALAGQVLIAGGGNFNGSKTVALKTAELFNPAGGGTFTLTTGKMLSALYEHAAAQLP
ncbi:Kelch repeat-containing protein [Candidatus Binatus sp.]|uniref:Kelch repeat-containing protein n=1 Tax=Candidatus Binatus sp. TaxID=2811406 RepID=UPI003F95F0F4